MFEVLYPATRPYPATLMRIRFYLLAIDLFPEADLGLLMVFARTYLILSYTCKFSFPLALAVHPVVVLWG